VVLSDDNLDASLKTLALCLPSEKLLGQEQTVVAVDALYVARQFLTRALAKAHREALDATYHACADPGPYRNDRESIGRRRLKNRALAYLTALNDPHGIELATAQFDRVDNMTDRQAALSCLVDVSCAERERALRQFYDEWNSDPLVLDKWFSVQATSCLPDTLTRVVELSRHPDFTLENPNRVRSLVAVFCSANQVRFHAATGAGYRFLSDCVMEVDSRNPQLSARLVSLFNPWRRFDEVRRSLQQAELERISRKQDLSKDVFEIVERALG
jgi:aminopeptidase N